MKYSYLPLEEARIYVQSFKFKSKSEFETWAKTTERPAGIPSKPREIYKHLGWLGWGDFTGSGRIATRKRNWLPFEEARRYARLLNLKKREEYFIWAKSSSRPENIPSNPSDSYKAEWIDWSDWLGNGVIGVRARKWLDFEEAREKVRALNFSNREDYNAWAKSPSRPSNIPVCPNVIYKELGWKNMGDWLGTFTIAPVNRIKELRPFEDARAYVHSLNFETEEEFQTWSKTSARPKDIPRFPRRSYKNSGWSSMGDWLGTNTIASMNRVFRPFEDARKYIHTLEFADSTQYRLWAKTSARPNDIPAYPPLSYKNGEWTNWGDWLGNGFTYRKKWRPYEDARDYIHSLQLPASDDYRNWSRTSERPIDIPTDPALIYSSKWIGWSNWLGITNKWTKPAIIAFLTSLRPLLPTLKLNEVFAIIRSKGMDSLERRNGSISLILNTLKKAHSENLTLDVVFDGLIKELEAKGCETDTSSTEPCLDPKLPDNLDANTANHEDVSRLLVPECLHSVDQLLKANLAKESDLELLNFLVNSRVTELWQQILNAPKSVDLDKLRVERGDTYFQRIRNSFFSQYDGAISLSIPEGYSFKIKDNIVLPNMMQRLTAFRTLSEKRIGNWSGVGAGKTKSAILTSRVVKARLTVIIAYNSTIDYWENEILIMFPRSKVYKKETGKFILDDILPNYLLLNFEKFQQVNSNKVVNQLVQDHKIDFVVLDEIQNVKQRDPSGASLRRTAVKKFLSMAFDRNQNLYVLGMSATPVINNLFEGRALLEIVTGLDFQELKTAPTAANAWVLYEKFILHGIRYKPRHTVSLHVDCVEINGQHLLPRLSGVLKKGSLSTEVLLLEAKLPTVISLIRSGTLIFSYYKTGIIPVLQDSLRRAGFSTGLFTGDDKDGWNAFRDKKIDVLIATSPIGTGFNGLQYVCNRLIIISLPWTSAEFDQLVGRIHRQGSVFENVEVFIPQVVYTLDKKLSWDKWRFNKISFKRTLADAALDGVLPLGSIESEKAMLKKAAIAIDDWIKRTEKDEISVVTRGPLTSNSMETDLFRIARHNSEFTMMNAKINSSNSQTTHERLAKNPSDFYLYHSLFKKVRSKWSENPVQEIANSIMPRPDWIIGDFGCGEAGLAEILTNQIYSFDHVAVHENVTSCDLRAVPLADHVLDVVVFSLSLMGLNYHEYLSEAYRTLRVGGLLKIAETAGRWTESKAELLQKIRAAGFEISGEPKTSDHFIYVNAVKL